jgi:hypothetical protein
MSWMGNSRGAVVRFRKRAFLIARKLNQDEYDTGTNLDG